MHEGPGGEPDRPVLRRVLEVNQAVAAPGGGRVVVTSVELWSSHIVVHAAVVGGGPHPEPTAILDVAARRRHFEYTRVLHDDLGNTYGLERGEVGDVDPGRPFDVHHAIFRGPVSPSASLLVFRPNHAADEVEIEIPLA